MKKKKGNILIIVLIAILIVAAILLGLGIYNSRPQTKVRKQISLGNRYYEEMDYDRAIAAYTEALEIDPKNAEAKTALGDAYKARGAEYAEQSAEDPSQREKAVQDLETARTYYEEVLTDESLSEEKKKDVSDKRQETVTTIITIPAAPEAEAGPDTQAEVQESQAGVAELNLYQAFHGVSDEVYLSSREAKRGEMEERRDAAYQIDGVDVGYGAERYFAGEYFAQVLEQADGYADYNFEPWSRRFSSSKQMLYALLAAYYADAPEDAEIRQHTFSELEAQLSAGTVTLVQSDLYDYISGALKDYARANSENHLSQTPAASFTEVDDYYLFEVTPPDGSDPVKLLFRDYNYDNFWGEMITREPLESVKVSIHQEEYPLSEDADPAHVGTEIRCGFVDMIVLEDNSSTSNEHVKGKTLQVLVWADEEDMDRTLDDGTVVFTGSCWPIQVFIPDFDEAERIIQQEIKATIDGFRETANRVKEDASTGFDSNYPPSVCDSPLDDAFVSGQALSFSWLPLTYYNKSAHGAYDSVQKNYDAVTGRALSLGELLKEGADFSMLRELWRSRLADLDSLHYGPDECLSMIELSEDMKSGWYFSKDGLTLVFPQGMISSYGALTIKVPISYNDLKEIIKEEYLPADGPAEAGSVSIISREERPQSGIRRQFGFQEESKCLHAVSPADHICVYAVKEAAENRTELKYLTLYINHVSSSDLVYLKELPSGWHYEVE